jgi:hypothetical protein
VRKTPDEVTAEIAALSVIKPKLPKMNFFGEDNHNKVDIQIEVLHGDVDGEQFEDMVDNGEWTDSERDEAQSALDWMEGYSEDPAPSIQWAELIS